MSAAIPVSFSLGYRAARATNSTDASFASKVPTVTEPAGAGVLALAKRSLAPTWLMLVPFGVTNNQTFDLRVVGWRHLGSLWLPTILLQFSVTLGNVNGVAGSVPADTDFVADTVSDPATGMGAKGVDCQPTSPANDTPASYMMDTRGCEKVEILFDMTGATSGNCLVAEV
jgi:hypothetical protein